MIYRNLLERIRNLICLEEQADELGERSQFKNILVAEMQVAAVDGAWTIHTDRVMYALDKLAERRNTLPSMLKDYFTQAGLDWREILPKEEAEVLARRICEATKAVPIDHHKGENCPRCDSIERALSTPPSAKTAPPEPSAQDFFAECDKALDEFEGAQPTEPEARAAVREFDFECTHCDDHDYPKCRKCRRMREELADLLTRYAAKEVEGKLEEAAKVGHKTAFEFLGMQREQRAYSWHDVEDALAKAAAAIRALKEQAK